MCQQYLCWDIPSLVQRKGRTNLRLGREIHPLDPQPHRHSMLVPRVCAPRVTQCSLGKYWSRDFFQKKAGRMLAGIHACATGFAAISVWPRACETSRQPILGYTGYLWLIVVWGSEIWWCMHSAHSLSTTPRVGLEKKDIIFRSLWPLLGCHKWGSNPKPSEVVRHSQKFMN